MRAALVALFSGVAAFESWRSRSENLPSCPALLRLFAAYAMLAALRVPPAGVLPAPLGAAPTTAWSVILYNPAAITEVLLVTAFMIAIARERTALQHCRVALRDPLTGLSSVQALVIVERIRSVGLSSRQAAAAGC